MSLRTVAVWSLVLLGGGSSAIRSEFEVAAEAVGPPSAAVLASGDVMVAWAGPELAFGRRQPSLRVLDPEGVPRSQVVRLAPAAAEVDGPVVAALASGGAVAVWAAALSEASGGGVWAQQVGAGGEPIGERIRVATRDFLASDSVAVAGLPDGGFVVFWTGGAADSTTVLSRSFDWRGDPSEPVTRLSSPGPGYRSAPAVATLAAGGAVAVWESEVPGAGGSSLVARRIDAAGAVVGPELEVVSADDGWNRSPVLASTNSGGAVLVWRLGPRSWPTGPEHLLAALLDPDAALEGDPREVDASYRALPAVAAADDGRFIVAWGAHDASGGALGLRARGFAADGDALGQAFRLDPALGTSTTPPAVVADRDGSFVAVYGRDGRVLGTRLAAGPSAGAIRVLDAERTVVERDAWVEIRLLRSGGSNGAVSVEAVIHPDNAIPGIDFEPGVAPVLFDDGDLEPQAARIRILGDAAPDGAKRVRLELVRAGGGAVLAEPTTATVTIVDDDPLPEDPGPPPLGPERPVAEPGAPSSWPAVAPVGDDGFLVAWLEGESPTEVRVRRFDAAGEPLGPPWSIGHGAAPSAFAQSACSVASDGITGFVLWSTADAVVGRLVDPSGVPVGPEIEIATVACDLLACESVDSPSAASLPGGEYQATWRTHTSGHHDLGRLAVESRRISADGDLLADTIRLGLGSVLDISGFATVVEPGGAIVVAVGRSGSGPWLARWSADSSVRWIRLAAAPSPAVPAMAAAVSGAVVVAWADRDASGYQEWSDLKARRAGPDGAPRGGAFRLNRSTAGQQSRPALAVDDAGEPGPGRWRSGRVRSPLRRRRPAPRRRVQDRRRRQRGSAPAGLPAGRPHPGRLGGPTGRWAEHRPAPRLRRRQPRGRGRPPRRPADRPPPLNRYPCQTKQTMPTVSGAAKSPAGTTPPASARGGARSPPPARRRPPWRTPLWSSSPRARARSGNGSWS